MSFEEQVLKVIRSSLPSHAQFHEVNSVHSYYLFASWRLDGETAPIERMSKAIAICLSHEASSRFEDIPASEQQRSLQGVADFVAMKLEAFDPNHDAPPDQTPPAEYWFIDSQLLAG